MTFIYSSMDSEVIFVDVCVERNNQFFEKEKKKNEKRHEFKLLQVT